MTMLDSFLRAIRDSARRVAFSVLAGILRDRGREQIEARISERPPFEQTLIVAAVLAALFLTSLIFAQGGLIGLLVFFLLVIFLIQ
ncbi:hypothetical protein EV663_10941 [Rhodovulum bhavnagarense]|uniref:Uncharacterized protein n=1 Tax=Rhodovulum bhavnagarense TaxID=992286 RepID=A0A4R2RMV7_9RHOB|nr:hypothetical protein [Rhodovulum bhavnagarense]TCP60535.1 hypothetical protein EV663_10941 [Rhodovulum bhavnagarense]